MQYCPGYFRFDNSYSGYYRSGNCHFENCRSENCRSENCRYENYCSEIKFTIPNNNYSFTLTVPNPEKIHPINFDLTFKGKLAFGYYEPDKDCVHNIEYTSYRVADITNAFSEFISKMEI